MQTLGHTKSIRIMNLYVLFHFWKFIFQISLPLCKMTIMTSFSWLFLAKLFAITKYCIQPKLQLQETFKKYIHTREYH